MLSKKCFDEYRFARMEVERLKEDRCLVADTVRGSNPDSPYTMRTVTVRGVDPVRRERNLRRIRALEKMCAEVESAIDNAPNSQIRMILEMKYCEGLGWLEVGDALDLSGDGCRKQAERYLASITGKKANVLSAASGMSCHSGMSAVD